MKYDILKGLSVPKTRFGLKVMKASPEIMIGFGLGSIFCGGIYACSATLKVDEVIEESKTDLAKIHAVHDNPEIPEEKYSDMDYRKDLGTVYFRAASKLFRLYWPALALGTVGTVSILCGYKTLHTRYIGATAACAAIGNEFKDYRGRVISELGEDADKRFKYGFEKKDIEVDEETEDGTVKKKKIKDAAIIGEYSDYARYFDSGSPDWTKSPEYNLMFLKAKQQYANDLLTSRGHIFLNEVYDMLGIPRTKAGAVVGWVKGNGDDYVDFGIYDAWNERKRDFVNGYENVIILDFNVDGVILDLI